jgi:hypothetical protein
LSHFYKVIVMTLETFMSRHGEAAIAGMLENWERFMGMRPQPTLSVEDRWQAFMSESDVSMFSAMAH